ncbi:MAG: hypothetical protein II918_00615 [Firmicutes bacterium]|nr:hypothetical protein [Bacillota bacterium]
MSKNETYEKINSLDNKNDLVAFLQGCMTENLNHARHIETEIHTFTGIYMAVVAGVLGFGFSISKDWLSDIDAEGTSGLIVNILPILMYGILLGGGWISLNLLNRWYEAFDRHMVYAEKAYYMLEALLMRGKEVSDVVEIWNWSKDELAELADLDPIFAFNHPKKPKVISTRKLVKGFHMVIFVVMLIVFISSLISVIVSA